MGKNINDDFCCSKTEEELLVEAPKSDPAEVKKNEDPDSSERHKTVENVIDDTDVSVKKDNNVKNVSDDSVANVEEKSSEASKQKSKKTNKKKK